MKRIHLLLLSLLSILTLGVFGFMGLRARAEQSQPNLYHGLATDKTKVRPGEEFQYTVRIQNKEAARTFTGVLVQAILSKDVDYVAGSGEAEKNGKTLPVTDNWLNVGTNLGTFAPSQEAWVRFKVKAKADLTPGMKIISAAQISAQDVAPSAVQWSIDVVSQDDVTTFEGGNFLRVANVTTGNDGWHDQEVTGENRNVIEYSVRIRNNGQHEARNVKIAANLTRKENAAREIHPSVTVSSDNAPSITDDVTVKASTPAWLYPYLGHSKKFGNTGLYDCTPNPSDPQGGCPIPEQFYSSPMNIGTVAPGEERTIQIIFKSSLIFIDQQPLACTGVCSTDADCKEGLKCLQVILGGPSGKAVMQCRNPVCKDATSCLCDVTAPTCNSRCNTKSDCPSDLICYKNNDSQGDRAGYCRKESNVTNNLCQDTKVCNSECTQDSQCNDGLICYKANSSDTKAYCRHRDNPSDNNCDNRKEGGFIIRKYFDENGNGKPEDKEKGLSWKFEWDLNADGNYRSYETFEKSNGEGGRVGGLHDGDQVRIREKSVDGWSATSPSEITVKIKVGETQYMQFGNWKGKPQVMGATTVKQLPKSGFNIAQSLAAVIGMSALGIWLKKKSLS